MARHANLHRKHEKAQEKGPRLPKTRPDATYDWVEDRGEVKPRCRFCRAVVPMAKWWEHACPSQRPPF